MFKNSEIDNDGYWEEEGCISKCVCMWGIGEQIKDWWNGG